jgi:DNA-directed RNA polymerase subunit M/transcription elongation factor TFIIS
MKETPEAKPEVKPEAAPTCPKCGSIEIGKRHHDGTFSVPECDFMHCDDCDHQWGHQ